MFVPSTMYHVPSTKMGFELRQELCHSGRAFLNLKSKIYILKSKITIFTYIGIVKIYIPWTQAILYTLSQSLSTLYTRLSKKDKSPKI
jgi:hypothetical protein